MLLFTPLKYPNRGFFISRLKFIILNFNYILLYHILHNSNSILLPIRHKQFSIGVGISILNSAIFRKMFYSNKHKDLFPGFYLILYSQALESLDSFIKVNSFNLSSCSPFALLYKRKLISINKTIINKFFSFNKQITNIFIFFFMYNSIQLFAKLITNNQKFFQI